MRILHWLDEYFFIVCVGFIIGVLFLIKGYDEANISTRASHIRYVVGGMIGSMFITWLGFELFLYFGLPDKLSVALGGLLAYLGTDKIALYFEAFLQKKLGLKKENGRKDES